jgi:glycosyltransferase involved in cell wall biosynthesis
MRILVFSHYYPPEVNAPASRTSEHCRIWAGEGHDVTVVTCAPNHPHGRLYDGYSNRRFEESKDGRVRVVRIWTYLAANAGFARRTLNHLSFLVSAAAAMPRLARPDIVLTTSPQLFCGLVGIVAKWKWRVPWVFEVRDLWPESIVAVGAMKRGPVIRALEAVETYAYRKADHVVPVADGFVPHIATRRRSRDGITVLKNGVDLELFRRSDGAAIKRRLGISARFLAVYVGTHGMAHGLDSVLDAAALLKNEPDIGFLLVGDGADRARLIERSDALGLANVHFAGQLPKSDMPAIWSGSDASLVLLKRSDTFRKVLPSKMFEAMAMACPIVLGVEGEAKALLDDADAGLAVTPEDPVQLADAVRRLACDPALASRLGQGGLAYVRAHFDRRRIASRYLELLASCRHEQVHARAA